MKTAHRLASRQKRAALAMPAALPKFWRPKTAPDVQLTCKIIHWDLIELITQGKATRAELWDWMETGFTYSQLMRLLAQDGTEFTPEAIAAVQEQIDSYEAIAQRYQRTGRVGFTGPELLIARAAAEVFTDLIALDRNGYAQQAAMWSTVHMLKAQSRLQAGSGS